MNTALIRKINVARVFHAIREHPGLSQGRLSAVTQVDRATVSNVVQQLEADGLQEAVHILGRVPDETLLGWYHAADVFALPAINVGGKFEGYGLVYIEASAAGLPVVGTLDCGAEDAIRDGETFRVSLPFLYGLRVALLPGNTARPLRFAAEPSALTSAAR